MILIALSICVLVLISSKTITENKQGITVTAEKKKITCDFCDKHPVIQIITLLGEIKYVGLLEPPTCIPILSWQ